MPILLPPRHISTLPRTACRSSKSTRSIADVQEWHSKCVLNNRSTEQDFPYLSTGLADQFPLVNGGQFLDRRLHPASFRLVQAGKLDEQPTRWIGTGAARPRAGHVLCVAHGHIPGDAGVDRSATAEDEIDVPALRRSCLCCLRTGQ